MAEFPGENPYTAAAAKGVPDWLDWYQDVTQAVEDIQDALRAILGGPEGVIADSEYGMDAGLVTAISPPSTTVYISAGRFMTDKIPFRIANGANAGFAVPATNDRIDTIAARLSDRSFILRTGTESGTPTAPAVGDGEVLLAHVYLRPGMTEINDVDVSPGDQGYITDQRDHINA